MWYWKLMMAGHDELICSEVHTFTSSNKEKDSSVSTFTFVNPIKKTQASVKKVGLIKI